MIRFIVNPGDFQGVIETNRVSASTLYETMHGSRLYRCSSQLYMSGRKYIWEEYTKDQGWMGINRDNLPIKVLEAGER